MTSSLVNRQKTVETVTLKPLRHSLQVVDSVTMTSLRQLAGSSSNALLSPASAKNPRKMSDNSLNGSDVFTNCVTDASSLEKSRAGSLQARRLRVASSSYDSTRNAGDTSLLAETSSELKSASASQLHNRRYSERSRSIDGERSQVSIGGLFGERRTSLRSRQSSIVDSSGGSGHHRASNALLLDTDIPAIRLERVADRTVSTRSFPASCCSPIACVREVGEVVIMQEMNTRRRQLQPATLVLIHSAPTPLGVASSSIRLSTSSAYGLEPSSPRYRKCSKVYPFYRHHNDALRLMRFLHDSLSIADKVPICKQVDEDVSGSVIAKLRTPQEALVLKLWSWAHMVTCLLKMFKRCRLWARNSGQFDEQLNQVRVTVTPADKAGDEVTIFDPTYYKADDQRKMTIEFKRILLKPPAERTDQEIRYVILALMSIKAIADFPLRMQNKLARNATFECYDGGRLILKEGHAPHKFYFILFGTVIIAVLDEMRNEMKTKCMLRRGDFFGELGIINRTNRQSSVMTKDYVEFLTIDAETYRMIFMQGGTRSINDPDHSEFLQSLSFLRGWPINILDQQGPESVIFCFFKRGTVIVKDSSYSDWIYIIKSGSVQVLKKLVHRQSTISTITGLPIKHPIDVKRRLFDFATPTTRHLSQRATSARARLQTYTKEAHRKSSMNLENTSESASNEQSSKDAEKTKQPTPQKSDSTPKEERRTFVDDLEKRYKEHVETEADRNPAFVFIKTLTKRDVFGLPTIVFDSQPGLCLVSNGAECVMINKALYARHCPEKLLSRLRLELSPFPEDAKMQADYVNRINWNAYKQHLLTRRTVKAA